MLRSMNACRTRLTVLWFAWASALLLIVFVQLALKHYGANWRDALEWLLPAVLPTTSLVAGVWAAEIAKSDKTDRLVPLPAFRMAVLGSIVYLSFVTLVMAAQPFYDGPPVDLMHQSALFLAPLQGIVGAFIGIFFSQTSRGAHESAGGSEAGAANVSASGQPPPPVAQPGRSTPKKPRGQSV